MATFVAIIEYGDNTQRIEYEADTPSGVIQQVWNRYGMSTYIADIIELDSAPDTEE